MLKRCKNYEKGNKSQWTFRQWPFTDCYSSCQNTNCWKSFLSNITSKPLILFSFDDGTVCIYRSRVWWASSKSTTPLRQTQCFAEDIGCFSHASCWSLSTVGRTCNDWCFLHWQVRPKRIPIAYRIWCSLPSFLENYSPGMQDRLHAFLSPLVHSRRCLLSFL